MDNRLKIVVIHHNSLCCLAMRTILTDIAPFVNMFRDVEIASYNSFEEFIQSAPSNVIHYFVAETVVKDNLHFFRALSRRCIVLTEGKPQEHCGEFRCVDIHCPERELLKSFLSMHNAAHHAHGMHPHSSQEETELLSQREKEVLTLIVKGYINKEIADMLNISTPTVIFHRRNISEKIGSKAIGRQTIYAVMNGLIDVNEL